MLIKTKSAEKRNSSNKKMFEYTCDCGDTRYYIETVVKNNRVNSCPNCSKKNIGIKNSIDISNMTFGSWTVLCKSDKQRKSRNIYWKCKCICGDIVDVIGSDLRSGKSKMCRHCSAKNTANNRSHFKDNKPSDNHRIYRIWKNMKQRCYGNHNIEHYANKGVTVCREWKDDFISFYNWSINNGYKDNLDLDKDMICDRDRISPKIYSPQTCIWITKQDNARYSLTKDLVEKENMRNAFLQ